jgi:hypothetical protein
MKKTEVPQDDGNLAKNKMRELLYATDENGNYTTELSTGWEPKSIALSNSIADISERTEEARKLVLNGEASPIMYFMELNKMDLAVLASYVGMWQWRVKRHFNAEIFKKLSDSKLSKYAAAFGISLDALKNFKG